MRTWLKGVDDEWERPTSSAHGRDTGPMLELFDDYSGTHEQKLAICRAWDEARDRIQKETRHTPRDIVKQTEARVAHSPSEAFRFDDHGFAALGDYAAGRFACRSLNSLHSAGSGGRLKLWVVVGTSPATDIGALQALAPPHSLFQAASQFNCLESPGPYIVPVAQYFSDPTQGPRASVSAFPATLLRHYASPVVQRDPGPQLNLLHRVALPGVAQVEGGYLLANNIPQPKTFASLLHDHFDEVEVGLHEGAQVVLGANWDGPVEGPRHIAQVFTSTIAAGGYSKVNTADPVWRDILTQLQRAAYLGTLRAAASSGQRRAVLTLIGGGVFGNPIEIIWDSIVWACEQVAPKLSQDLTVIVNGRILEGLDLDSVETVARQWGGDLLRAYGSGTGIKNL